MKRAVWYGLVAAVAACSSPSPPPPEQRGGPPAPGAAAGAAGEPPAPPRPAYGPEVTSLRLRRSIVVRFAPDEAAKAIGTVLASTRVGWRSSAPGPGCDRWIEIEPRGWVCDRYLEPSTKPPGGEVLPRLEDGEIVPGEYGKLSGTGVTLRKVAEVAVGARTFWKTSDGKLVDARRIRPDRPSTFAGVWLEPGQSLPLGFARKLKKGAVAVRATPEASAPALETLAPRTVVAIAETRGDWARVGDGRWVATAELHVAAPEAPPEDVRGASEKWIDVDLDSQIVVAYEGVRPVFATLASTGSAKWPTAPGIYRIWLKYAETDMNGQMGDERPYSVATVPWTMFFARDLAFHTAYWHDRFGEARSHGCVNLSPRDAKALYDWALPDVPAGWTMAGGIFERPGTLVRIHGTSAPASEYRGYAKVVHEKKGPGEG